MFESNQETQTPSRADVAAMSRPKKAILIHVKEQKMKRDGKVYKPTKKESIPPKTINWHSPALWPLIDQAARQQAGKPNLTELLRQLQQRDGRFTHLKQQRLSEWRDQSVSDRIVWSKKTLAKVKKGFLPGGIETRFNIFVSQFKPLSTHYLLKVK